MPPASVDPDRLRSLGAALGPLGECARDGAEEVLAQFPELGHRETQAALDGWVEQAADLLREIGATASDLADVLRVAALNAPEPPPGHEQSDGTEQSHGTEQSRHPEASSASTHSSGEVSW